MGKDSALLVRFLARSFCAQAKSLPSRLRCSRSGRGVLISPIHFLFRGVTRSNNASVERLLLQVIMFSALINGYPVILNRLYTLVL